MCINKQNATKLLLLADAQCGYLSDSVQFSLAVIAPDINTKQYTQ